jgi:hypothetical protein
MVPARQGRKVPIRSSEHRPARHILGAEQARFYEHKTRISGDKEATDEPNFRRQTFRH